MIRLHSSGQSLFRPHYAMLLDGGFTTKKLYQQLGRHATADDVVKLCEHLRGLPQVELYELLRIYYYDAPPSSSTISKPVSRNPLNLAGTERFRQSQSLHDQLIQKDNFALRMGETSLSLDRWKLKPRTAKALIKQPRSLSDEDFDLDLSQKGVDMRIGLDMARLCLRETVAAMIVVTGDSDFVPAFKFVRREGVRIILVTLGHQVRPELRHHADIIVSDVPKFQPLP